MKKIIGIIIIALTALIGCQKDNEPKEVTYFIQGFGDPYKVVFTYGDSSATKTQTVTPDGISDSWSYSFTALPGEIAYIYVESKEDISNSMHFITAILIDGKIYQKALSYDLTRVVGNDTVNTIKRSGTIPF